MNLADLAAFNPKKLAAGLVNLPEGAIVFALPATGPIIAVPKSGREAVGEIVYEANTISIWTGSGYHLMYLLQERDGQPVLLPAELPRTT